MKIQKGKHVLEVSPDAYKSMYKRLKYEIVGKQKPLASNKNEDKNDNKNEK